MPLRTTNGISKLEAVSATPRNIIRNEATCTAVASNHSDILRRNPSPNSSHRISGGVLDAIRASRSSRAPSSKTASGSGGGENSSTLSYGPKARAKSQRKVGVIATGGGLKTSLSLILRGV